MTKPAVTVIVCGRFHFHKYIHLLNVMGILQKFIYSYKLKYSFNIDSGHLKNYPLKEYLMYFGRKFFKGNLFYIHYLPMLHNIWQQQVRQLKPAGNVVHFLVHGNCFKIISEYRKKGIKVIGEVVNAHPVMQEQLLTTEYTKYGLVYESGEKTFKDKIIFELGLCDYLLVPSSFIKDSLVKHGIGSEKIKVLPYGLSEIRHKKENSYIEKNKTIKILCVAQITFRKGIIYLLKALELCRQQGYDCELTLVGLMDPIYEPVIRNYLAAPFVHYIDHVDNKLVYELMIQHDLFVIPSVEDGFGIVVCEALSVNLPAIVTKNCGASEIIDDGVNGFVIEAFSETNISEAIIKSIEYKFDFSKPIPNWNEYATALEKIYRDVLLN